MSEKEARILLTELKDKQKYTLIFKGNGTKVQENRIFFDLNDDIIDGFKFYAVYQNIENSNIYVVLPIP